MITTTVFGLVAFLSYLKYCEWRDRAEKAERWISDLHGNT